MKVQVITSNEACPSCDKTKTFLDMNSIPYKEIKIDQYRDKDHLGNEIGVPKVLIWENDIPILLWTGFRISKLKELLNTVKGV